MFLVKGQTMTATIIDGRAVAAKVQDQIAADVEKMKAVFSALEDTDHLPNPYRNADGSLVYSEIYADLEIAGT